VNLRFKLILLTLLFILPTLGISMGLEVVNVSTPQFNKLMKKHPEIMVLAISVPPVNLTNTTSKGLLTSIF